MLVLSLRQKHSNGTCILDAWRTEHGDITISVYDSAGGEQFDFDFSDEDIDDLVLLLKRAKNGDNRRGGRML